MASLAELVSQLNVASQGDSYDKVYELGQKVLKEDPQNFDALKQCLISLINQDRYDRAGKLLEEHSDIIAGNQQALLIERAYIYYKMGNDTALRQLIPQGETSRGFQHVLAQHNYQSGKSVEALEVYRALLQDPQGEELDLSVNERAVISQIKYEDVSSEAVASSKSFTDSYDSLSNDAMIKLREADYDGALQLLTKALQVAEDATEQYDAETKAAETNPIKVQIAYAKQLAGDVAGAEQILDQFDLAKIEDQVLRLLISNNLASIKGNDNSALLYRELGFPNSVHEAESKLTIPQLKSLQRNDLILGYKSGKQSKSHDAGSLLGLGLYSLYKAGIELQDLPYNHNVKPVLRLAVKQPQNLALGLIAAQINLTYGNLQNAAQILESVASDEALVNTPSLTPLLYYVYEKLDRRASIVKLLNRLYDGLQMKEVTPKEFKLLEFVAFQLLPIDSAKAQDLFKKIDKGNPLVAAVLGEPADLPSVDSLTGGIDADQLIKQGVAPLFSGLTSKKVTPSKVTKHSRKRKAKFDGDSKPLDEERWLPMKDRSYYRQKKSKHKTQGGVADESLDITDKPKKKDKKKGRR